MTVRHQRAAGGTGEGRDGGAGTHPDHSTAGLGQTQQHWPSPESLDVMLTDWILDQSTARWRSVAASGGWRTHRSWLVYNGQTWGGTGEETFTAFFGFISPVFFY